VDLHLEHAVKETLKAKHGAGDYSIYDSDPQPAGQPPAGRPDAGAKGVDIAK
jgi:hypothetical protein